MTTTSPPGDGPRSSRFLHRFVERTTRPLNAFTVGTLVIISWVAIVLSDFDEGAQLAFGTVCAGLTVTMVFVLQHTQRREQVALQLKLNEIVRALPRADNHLVGIETSSDAELVEIGRSHVDQHAALRDHDGPADPAL
jgi:low affinity Fe/Cu permease